MKQILIIILCALGINLLSQQSLEFQKVDTLELASVNKFLVESYITSKENIDRRTTYDESYGYSLSAYYQDNPIIISGFTRADKRVYFIYNEELEYYKPYIEKGINCDLPNSYSVLQWQFHENKFGYYFFSRTGLNCIKKTEIGNDKLPDYKCFNSVLNLLFFVNKSGVDSENKFMDGKYKTIRTIENAGINTSSWYMHTDDKKLFYGKYKNDNATIVDSLNLDKIKLESLYVNDELSYAYILDSNKSIMVIDLLKKEIVKKIDNEELNNQQLSLYFIDVSDSETYIYLFKEYNINQGLFPEFILNTKTYEVINLNILIENNNLECYQKFSFIPNSDKIAWISRDNNYIYYFNYYDLVSKERKRIDITALIPNKNTGDYISIRDFSFNKAGDELTLITEFMVLYSFKIYY